MSELQAYYDNYCKVGAWQDEDPALCGCRGSGWWLSDLDTEHSCSYHYDGTPSPEALAHCETGEEMDEMVRHGKEHFQWEKERKERPPTPLRSPSDEDDDCPF